MKITYSHIDRQFRDAIELESARHVERLNRLLKRYPPDSAQLHCSMEKTPRRTEFGFVVNLTLTAGVLMPPATALTCAPASRPPSPNSTRK